MTPRTRLSADVTRARLVRSDISGANDAVTRTYLAEYEDNGQAPRRARDTQGEILRDPEGKVAVSRSSSEIHPARPASHLPLNAHPAYTWFNLPHRSSGAVEGPRSCARRRCTRYAPFSVYARFPSLMRIGPAPMAKASEEGGFIL